MMNDRATIELRIHGGPDIGGVPQFDFSTNSNACGPCPLALAAVQQADASRYPDPSYTALKAQLADFHRVDVGRILLAGSASEFIFRITAWVAQQGGRRVSLPRHGYGDYAHAARAWNLEVTTGPSQVELQWACEPSSPLGGPHMSWANWPVRQVLVLDRAYEPLRLSGTSSLNDDQLAQTWQLWTPNKALGLTGVRAAYVIAPLGADEAVAALERLCPSWPLGAHGVALLQAWVQPAVQDWLHDSLHTLRGWKARQLALLQNLGWDCTASDTPFFCARPAAGCNLTQLRAAGIKLRDTTSFGLPGHVRVSVQAPLAQDALAVALQAH